MPFNPGVNYHGDQFIFQGGMAAGRDIAAGITSGTNAATSAYVQAQKENQMTQDELDFLSGTAGQLHQGGALSDDDLQKFQKGGIGTKRAIVSQGGTKAGQMWKEKMEHDQHNFQLTLEEIRAANHAKEAGSQWGNLSPEDLETYRKAGMMPVRTSGRSWQVVPDPTIASNQQPQEIDLGDGRTAYFDPRMKRYVPKSAMVGAEPASKPDQARVSAITSAIQDKQQKIDEYQREIDSGNKKWGPDKWPWNWPFPSYQSEIDKLKGEQKGLQGNIDAIYKRPGQSQPPAQGGNPPPAAAPAKSEQKDLTPDVAADFLKKAGRDRKRAMQMAREAGYTIPEE